MLQQTRVAAVIPYFERFLARFPDAKSLAKAAESEVLALWSGLGYYSRARNLQAAARQIAEMGAFPSTYEEIRDLRGVGDYTAAAIASACFGLPFAVFDGNVARVTARLTNNAGDIRASATRKRLMQFAAGHLPKKEAGIYNQAMMELGATVCLPRNPQCLLCPVSDFCEGRKAGRAEGLPVKLGKQKAIVDRQTLVIVEKGDGVLMRQRPAESSRMAGFWELPFEGDLRDAVEGPVVGEFRHAIVNHSYRIAVKTATLRRKPPAMSWIPVSRMREFPVGTTARKALDLWAKVRQTVGGVKGGFKSKCPRSKSRF